MDTSGYLNDATDIVRVGDMILANTDTDGTAASGIFLVNANAAGVVDLADMTAVGGTDLDLPCEAKGRRKPFFSRRLLETHLHEASGFRYGITFIHSLCYKKTNKNNILKIFLVFQLIF